MATDANVVSAVEKIIAANVQYSVEQKCYVVTQKRYSEEKRCMVEYQQRKVGLRPTLDSFMYVPKGQTDKRSRRSKNDAVTNPTKWKSTNANAHYKKLAVGSCHEAVSKCKLAGMDDATFDQKHGSLVDQQLKLRVQHGSKVLSKRDHDAFLGGLDPCTATILDYVKDTKRRIVAAQSPLYSESLGCATALDILTNDGALFEIKARAVTDSQAIARSDANYEKPRARLTNTALRGLPCSYYGFGQVQLHITRSMIKETTGWEPPTAAVLRVSPGLIMQYDLNPYFKSRAEKFHKVIAQQTGQDRRNKRLARHTKKVTQ